MKFALELSFLQFFEPAKTPKREVADGYAKGVSGIQRAFDMRLPQKASHHVGHLFLLSSARAH